MPDYGDLSHHTKRYSSYTSGGATVVLSYYDAERGTRGPYSFRKWYTCHLCGFDYPEDQVMIYGGIPYCIPRRDYLEYKTRPRR